MINTISKAKDKPSTADALHATAIEAACDLDRAYFARHPEAREYVRPGLAHEACMDRCWTPARVRVVAYAPGVRLRQALAADR